MKKITLFLCINACMFMNIKSMDVENNNNSYNQHTPSQQYNNTHNSSSNKSSNTAALLKENNVLLHTLIMQNKIHFEYHDDTRFTTNMTINQHAKNTKIALDNLYRTANQQLQDQSLHFPMTGQTKK